MCTKCSCWSVYNGTQKSDNKNISPPFLTRSIHWKKKWEHSETRSGFKSVWKLLMGSNRKSTVQLSTQIFGVHIDTWQSPSPWNSMQATGCERLEEKKSTFPRTDKCWNASECRTVVYKWFMINLSFNFLTGLSQQNCRVWSILPWISEFTELFGGPERTTRTKRPTRLAF